MFDLQRFGNNIRALRNAFGETQETLCEILHIGNTTLSNYELGIRRPNDDNIIEAIAKHFGVTTEDLMYSDLSDIGTITVDQDLIYKNIAVFFPIIQSEKAMEDKHFEGAYNRHLQMYNRLQMKDKDPFEYIDYCFDGYSDAYENTSIKPEAAANILALWYISFLIIKTAERIKCNSAILLQLASKDPKLKRSLEDSRDSILQDAQEASSYIDAELIDQMDEMMKCLKRSDKWSDLADYYLAMKYNYNIIENDLGAEFNERIGAEMLASFAALGNMYAARYLSSMISMRSSPQNVDDK